MRAVLPPFVDSENLERPLFGFDLLDWSRDVIADVDWFSSLDREELLRLSLADAFLRTALRICSI